MASAPLIERTATAATARDFVWPDFDHWQATFAAIDVFPARWEGLHRAPPADTREAEAYQLRKLALLSEWLEMVAHRSTVRAHYARQGLRARVVRQDARPPCPACDPFNTREVRLELEAMPPFHPGCRCVIVAMDTGPARRRARSSGRTRSRTG
jgi:hypothetical protein